MYATVLRVYNIIFVYFFSSFKTRPVFYLLNIIIISIQAYMLYNKCIADVYAPKMYLPTHKCTQVYKYIL